MLCGVLAAGTPAIAQDAGDKVITNSLGIKLALIPAGRFLMGSPEGEAYRNESEGPRHEVELTRPFYLGVCPVTVGQFRSFVGETGYRTEGERGGGAADAPAQQQRG